nr:Shedu immune nuclease family protein [Pseudomonas sp. DP-17]
MLHRKLPEQKWQEFFKANPFVLGLAFPYPVILFKDQANVGGTTFDGKNESIVDFLMAQRFTGNLAIVEIKRPDTTLLYSDPYRGDLYSPHRELTGSMAQALDQRAQLLHHFAGKKSQDPTSASVHVSSVNCIVIAGTLPTEPPQMRSLDLFRHSSKDVTVITFDELLEKLKELYRLMSGGKAVPAKNPQAPTVSDEADDLPF